MTTHEKYMFRCIELAWKGIGNVAPNPMVGAVIVHNGQIIGEGYHRQYGEAHAEVNAIRAVKRQELLQESVLYVNLEPCSHFGKTPPCASLIIEKQIPHVFIGNIDPYPTVSGNGIQILKEKGLEVTTGILDKKCTELNKRFFTFHRKKRPYIILKWAQTADSFIDKLRSSNEKPAKISTEKTMLKVHQLRMQESAIMVGTNTVMLDNPHLTVRHWHGKNPVRIAIDRSLKIPKDYFLFDGEATTLIFTDENAKNKYNRNSKYATFVEIDFSQNIIPQILNELYQRKILSLIVEGGTHLLQSFIDGGFYDEMQVEHSPITFGEGVKAPVVSHISAIDSWDRTR